MNTAAKRKKKQRLKAAPKRSTSTKRPALDRITDWLGRRSRFARVLICIGVAAVLTVDLSALLYGALLNANPNKLNFGPLNADNLSYALLFFVVIAGFALYWLGWRTLIGFDLDNDPLAPGRMAAVWTLLGLVAFILTLGLGSLTLVYALQT